MSELIPYPPCPICAEPLSAGEISLNRRWHFDCEKCAICGHSMSGSTPLIEKCLESGKPPAHTVCSEASTIREIKASLIPATREKVQQLNNQILVIRHELNPTQADVESYFELLKDLQECAANVSTLLTLKKDQIKIGAIQEFAATVRRVKKAESDTAVAEEEKKIKSAESVARKAAERANPELRDMRKAIEALCKIPGWNLEKAEAEVKKQIAARKGGSVQ